MQSTCAAETDSLGLSEALLKRFDVPGPRYTSYPTADRFVDTFGPAQYRRALQMRSADAPLSLYVHIPFCASVCYYCACNKVITKHHERSAEYLDALELEMDLQTALSGRGRSVTQLHLGGGTPTFLSDPELTLLMRSLRARFAIEPGAECSIEVDPRTVSAERLAHLAELGFNRLSFGVQDFNPAVQQAVHRVQPFEQVEQLMAAARMLRFDSINVDLIHGLPLQTPDSLQHTVAQTAGLRPDRVALYGYAHLPQRFKPQRRIDAAALPGASERLTMLSRAISGFLAQGYVYIGMDHFALPGDALAVARREGRLHRNFQGYSTQPDCDLIALGVSSIGKVGATYSQNAKELPAYYDALRDGELPVVRGFALGREDLVRRAAISALMCQGRIDIAAFEAAHGLDFERHFAAEHAQLAQFAEQGLLTLEGALVQVTAIGWYFVRAIAMVFDQYLQADRARAAYSRVL